MKSAQTMIQHDARPPSYWYSLDLISTGPSSIMLPLLEKEKEHVSGELTCRSPDELHCTMYYKYTQGPETTYEKRFFREKQTTLKLKHLYWNKEGCCAASCSLSPSMRKFLRSCNAHMCHPPNPQTTTGGV